MDTIDVLSLPPNFQRPHVVLLGAGASRAAFPNGDTNGKAVPLMNDLVHVLQLGPLLSEYGIDASGEDFEVVYSSLAADPQHGEVVDRLERRVSDYFSALRLPDHVTLSDQLVLALRPKDVIATFNWDAFLWEAVCRNGPYAPMPQVLFLHGNVAVGYCTQHRPITFGRRGTNCRTCGSPLVLSRLLYPVTKNYSDDPRIAASWQEAQNHLKDAFLLTIFGYGAPKTDVEAVQLMKQSWAHRSDSVLHDVEVIDIRNEHDLMRSWEPFIKSHYYQVHSTFTDSMANQNPRRTGEAMCAQNIDCQYLRRNTPPVGASLSRLRDWYKPLIEQEQTFVPPKVSRMESGNDG